MNYLAHHLQIRDNPTAYEQEKPIFEIFLQLSAKN